jgi:hypothetical protein
MGRLVPRRNVGSHSIVDENSQVPELFPYPEHNLYVSCRKELRAKIERVQFIRTTRVNGSPFLGQLACGLYYPTNEMNRSATNLTAGRPPGGSTEERLKRRSRLV